MQQAHTREWLGTFGEAGNGQRWPRFERVADDVVAYLRAHGLGPGVGLLRLDGEFGCARAALILSARGVGYLTRCADYRLLDAPMVREALASSSRRFVQTDTGTERDVYDVNGVPWTSEVDAKTVVTRLIVTRRRVGLGEEPRVGKRVGDDVYELFVTERAPEGLTALDVLSLYFARGGFEQTLSEEDREIEPDRWFSGNPHGQELAQILAQWLWNMRLQLGLVAAPTAPRVTLWSDASTSPEVAPSHATSSNLGAATTPAVEAPLSRADDADKHVIQLAESPPSEPQPQTLPERDGFTLQPDGTLRCPENKTLRHAEVRRHNIRFAARRNDCQACSRRSQCLGTGASGQRGRRFDWPAAALGAHAPPVANPASNDTTPTLAAARFTPPPTPGPKPVLWQDLPATALRRLLPATLRQQHVQGLPPQPSPTPSILGRDHRAHRRLTWQERMRRNARPAHDPPTRLHLHGIPTSLAAYLGTLPSG